MILVGFLLALSTGLLLPDGNRMWLFEAFAFMRDPGVCGPEGWRFFSLGIGAAFLGWCVAAVGLRNATALPVKLLGWLALVVVGVGVTLWLLAAMSWGCDV